MVVKTKSCGSKHLTTDISLSIILFSFGSAGPPEDRVPAQKEFENSSKYYQKLLSSTVIQHEPWTKDARQKTLSSWLLLCLPSSAFGSASTNLIAREDFLLSSASYQPLILMSVTVWLTLKSAVICWDMSGNRFERTMWIQRATAVPQVSKIIDLFWVKA